MSTILDEILQGRLNELRESGRYKQALELMSPQSADVRLAGRDTIMLSSNNYLGLSDHPPNVEISDRVPRANGIT